MGGNIFKDYASPITRDHIRPTLQKYMEHLGKVFPAKANVFKNFHPVGSVGKKEVSGDLDLAIDFSCFFEGADFNRIEMRDYRIDYTQWETLYKKLKSRARTATDDMCRWKAFLKLIAHPIVSEGVIHVANEKTTNGNLFTLFPQFDCHGQLSHSVQIDWMVGNLPWLKFAYHSGETGQLKGMHRTQLLVAMLSVKGYTFLHNKGIKEKTTNTFVATDPTDALGLLSGLYGTITREDTYNFYNLHNYLKSCATEEAYQQVVASYKRILNTSKSKIPTVLWNTKNENA